MKDQNRGPDFISIDGGEGGAGAAPLSFADHVSLPFNSQNVWKNRSQKIYKRLH